VSFSTFVVNYTVYFLQRQYRDNKEDATNMISVWLDQQVKEDSDTQMHNMIGVEDEFYEDFETFDGLSEKERFEQEIEAIQKYLCYLTHDEQYVFLVANGIYYTQMPIKVLAKEINVDYNLLNNIYRKARAKLENIFAENKTPEQQAFYEKYKDLKFSVLTPEEVLHYQLSSVGSINKSEPRKRKIFNNNFYVMQQKVEEIVQSNQLPFYKLSILQEKILYLYYGINTDALSSSQIAEKLGISLTSVTTHIGTIKRKITRLSNKDEIAKRSSVKNDIIEILNEHPNNIYLIPEKYHSLIKKYYGIGEPAVDFEQLAKTLGKSSSDLYKLLSFITSSLQSSYNMIIPLYVDDIEAFISQKDIQLDKVFNSKEILILKKFYGIGQPKTDIETIAKDCKLHVNRIIRTLNQINSKLNSFNGLLNPDINISNRLIKDIIEFYNINLEDILSELELKVIKIFVSSSFQSVAKDINSTLKLSTYKSNNLLFSALSKIIKIYNKNKLMNNSNADNFEEKFGLETGKGKKSILSKRQKSILSLYLGLDGAPLSIEQISKRLDVNPSKVYKDLKRIEQSLRQKFDTLDIENNSLLSQTSNTKTNAKTELNNNQNSWWTREFLLTLPLDEVLTHYKLKLVSLYFGFDEKPLSITEISEKLNVSYNAIASSISSAKNKIKQHMIQNNISYLTMAADKNLKPADVQTKEEIKEMITPHTTTGEKIKKPRKSYSWWTRDFLLGLPLEEILTPHQHRIISLIMGFDGSPKAYAELAKQINSTANAVACNVVQIKNRIKNYMIANNISYINATIDKDLKPADIRPKKDTKQEMLYQDSTIEEKTKKVKCSYSWWTKDFLNSLPLKEMLSPYQYNLIEMNLGFGGEPKTYAKIAQELDSNASSVANNIAFARKKIKKYMESNGISYLTEEARKDLKPVDLKQKKNEFKEETHGHTTSKKTMSSRGWWSKEFLIKLPLTEILTPHQYKLLDMNFGFDGEAKSYAKIAKELDSKTSSVGNNIAFAKKKIKKYLQENGISYLTETGGEKAFVPSNAIQNQANQNEINNYQFNEDENKIDINEQELAK